MDPGAAASAASPAKLLVEPTAPGTGANQESIGFTKIGFASFGGAYRDRTDDLLNAIQSLSQLS